MHWFPTVTSIKLIFIQLQELYNSLKNEHLMHERTLKGVVDKGLHREPSKNLHFGIGPQF